jgi:hypothetical protein
MSYGAHGYKSPIEHDEQRDLLADAIRCALPRRRPLRAWSALSEKKRNAWRFAADTAVRVFLDDETRRALLRVDELASAGAAGSLLDAPKEKK